MPRLNSALKGPVKDKLLTREQARAMQAFLDSLTESGEHQWPPEQVPWWHLVNLYHAPISPQERQRPH